MTTARLALCTVCLSLTAAAHAADLPPLAELAPENALLLIGTDDAADLRAQWERSPAHAFLSEPESKRFLEALRKDMSSQLLGALEDAGHELDELRWPTGLAGLALWFGVDPDRQTWDAQWFLAIEFDAEDLDDMEALAIDTLDSLERQGQIELEPTEIAALDAWRITGVAPPFDPDGFDPDAPPPAPRGARFRHEVFAVVENALVLASDTAAMTRLIDAVDGAADASLDELAPFNDAARTIDGAPFALVLMADAALDAIDEAQARDKPMDVIDALPIDFDILADQLGLSELRFATMGFRFPPESAFELAGAIGLDERRGLIALFDLPPMDFTPPRWIDAGASSYSAISIDYAAIIPLLRRVLMSLPDAQRNQALPQFEMFAGPVEPALRALGPETYIVGGVDRPFAFDSQWQLIALRAADRLAVSTLLENLGAAFFGLTRREFDGFEIWEAPPQLGAPFSIGLGAGHLFVGPTIRVEDALRTASAANASRLAGDAHYTRAARAGAPRGIGHQWADGADTLEYALWTQRNQEEIMRRQLEELWAEVDPEIREDWIDDAVRSAADQNAFLESFPDAQVWVRHFGDYLGEWTWSDEGAVWRSIILRPHED